MCISIDTYSGTFAHNRKNGLSDVRIVDGRRLVGDFNWHSLPPSQYLSLGSSSSSSNLKLLKRPSSSQLDGTPASSSKSSKNNPSLSASHLPEQPAALDLEEEVPDGWGFVSLPVAVELERLGSRCCAVTYEGDLRNGRREGLGVARYCLQILRAHPELVAAFAREPALTSECVRLIDSVTQRHDAMEELEIGMIGEEVDPLVDEFPFETSEGMSVVMLLSIWGGSYSGEWKDDRPHGQGVVNFLNGQSYCGEFQYGKFGFCE
jgi:hypothetical protein